MFSDRGDPVNEVTQAFSDFFVRHGKPNDAEIHVSNPGYS